MDNQRTEQLAKTIAYLQHNLDHPPQLQQMANDLQLNAQYLKQIFTEWAGVSPESFLLFMDGSFVKSMLDRSQLNLFGSADNAADGAKQFFPKVKVLGMTADSYGDKGKNLNIDFRWISTPFGRALIGNTSTGICYLQFHKEELNGAEKIRLQYPLAQLTERNHPHQLHVEELLSGNMNPFQLIYVHLKGTPFQLAVWQALADIPAGQITTYGGIATKMGKTTASRAIGNAIGRNPIAYLIPCHRVIHTGGLLGAYRWGVHRKSAMIAWESSRNQMVSISEKTDK